MAEGVAEERAANGPFARLDDFFERVPAKHLNKRALESLVKAGAFDALAERAYLLAGLDRLISYAQGAQKQRESGQTSLFDLMAPSDQPALAGPTLAAVPEAPQQQKLAWEKELLGIYLSEHPFASAAAEMRQLLTCAIAEVNAELSGRDAIIGGIVTGSRLLTTRDGRSFIAAEIEDQTGSIEVTVWPETLEQTRTFWESGNIVIANVRVRDRDDRLSAAVQRAALYGEGPIDAQSLFVEPQPSYGNGYRRNGGNGKGKEERGNGSVAPAAPRTTESASVARTSETERVNREESPAGTSLPGPAPIRAQPEVRLPDGQVSKDERSTDATIPVGIPGPLRITLEETDDPDGDHERLRALVNALRDYTGEDAVRLAIRQRDGEEVEMALPSARLTPELTHRLEEIVGTWGSVGA